jgi:hypothetical protein
MSNAAQTWATIGGVGILIGVQTFWIARALDRVDRALDVVERRLERIENMLRDQGERIARLETKA